MITAAKEGKKAKSPTARRISYRVPAHVWPNLTPALFKRNAVLSKKDKEIAGKSVEI